MVQKRFRVSYLLMALLLTCIGCFDRVFQAGPPRQDSVTVTANTNKLQSLRLEINTGDCVTRLDLSGNADDLLEATFIYNVRDWKPQVKHTENRTKATVTIETPDCSGMMGGDALPQNEWSLHVNERLPLNLLINHEKNYYAEEEAHFDLRGLTLRELGMRLKDGAPVIDLGGAWLQSFEAEIEANEAAVTLLLPDATGVLIMLDGIDRNQVEAGGLTAVDEGYINNAYGTTDVTIHLTLSGESGEFALQGSGE